MQCSVRESLKTQAAAVLSPVVVGDRVRLETLIDIEDQNSLKGQQPHGVIFEVAPRQSKFSRPKRGMEDLEQIVAANIDRMLAVSSVARPQFKAGLIDRFLITAQQGGLEPTIVINKIDLVHEIDLNRYVDTYASIGIKLICTSVKDNIGIEEFAECLKGHASIILGQSGVGKSSLLNAVDPELQLKIGHISDYSQKGTHTTTAVEMFPLKFGGYVVDTPGLKYLGLWEVEKDDLKHYFPEFARYLNECKFRNCNHINEPGCAVKAALKNGVIYPERYQSYLKLMEQLEE